MTKKPYPRFENDDEERAFLDTADLEEYELTPGGKPMRQWLADYEDMYRDARVNLRLPKALVLEFKRKAAARRMPYQRLMRAVLQEAAKSL
jgi:predicted DNA binding CopG/RHH family protein